MIRPEVVVDHRSELGEGPVWISGDEALIWVDISVGRLNRLVPATGQLDRLDIGQPVGAVVPRAAGGLLLALRDGVGVLDEFAAGERAVIRVEVEADLEQNRMNDGKCDPAGRFWVGTMSFAARPGAGSLYRVDADLSVTRVISGTTIANGLGWSPDGTSMYFTDSAAQSVWAFDFDASTGMVENRRLLISVQEPGVLPDGMAIDAEGGIWTALWGGSAVRRYSATGILDQEIPFPVSQVSSCAFGGTDLEDLYVTTARTGLSEAGLAQEPDAGCLFRLDPGVRGMPTTSFSG